MPKTPKQLIKEIFKNNPQVDLNRIIEVHEATERRRALGRQRRGYRLTLPMFRKRAHAVDDDVHDPRTLQLRQY
jgi:hypothetical protein